MADRSIITIVVQALDRASGVLRQTAREAEKLEQAEGKAAVSTNKLGTSQRDLARDMQKTNEQLSLYNEKFERTGTVQNRAADTLKSMTDRTREYREELRRTGQEQLSFFDRVAKSGSILGEQRRVLRDQFGESLTPAGMQRRVRESFRTPGSGGRFAFSMQFPLGGSDQVEKTNRALDGTEKELQQIQGQMRLIDEFGTVFKLQRDAANAERQLKRVATILGRMRESVATRRMESFFGLGSDRDRGDLLNIQQAAIAIRRLTEAREQLNDAIRRTPFEQDRRELESDRDSIIRLINSIDRGVVTGRDFNAILGRLGRVDGIERLSRAVRLHADEMGEDRPLARGWLRFRRSVDDFDQRLTPRVSRGLAFIARRFGITGAEMERFTQQFRQRQRQLLDFTSFDETIEIGFRRVTRLLAVITTILPIVTVLFGAATGAVTGLVGGVVALVGAFAQLAGVVATLPALFAATLGAAAAFVAVVGPGIKSITERFSEVLQLQDSARKQGTESAKGLTDAEQNLAESRVRAAEQIADAERSLADQRRDLAEDIADQERDLNRLRVRNAESERDIVRDIAREKRDAAEDAREAELRYQDIVKRNREDEREIIEELARRRAQQGALGAQGADPLTLARAGGAVSEQEKTLRTFQATARKEEREALNEVEKIKRDSAERIGDLERRLSRERRDNTQQENDAERKLARTRRDGLARALELERQLSRTRRDTAIQQRDALEALVAAQQKAAGDLTDSLKDLPPTERRIVQQLLRIRQQWLLLTSSVRERGLLLGERGLTLIERNLPAIADRFNQFASEVIGIADRAMARFTQTDRVEKLNRVLDGALDLTTLLGEAFTDVADTILTLADAARPLTDHIGRMVGSLAESARSGAERSAASGGLDEFFERTIRVLDLVVEGVRNLGAAMIDVIQVAEPFGELLLGDFVEWTERVRDFTTNEGVAMREFFADSAVITREVVGLLGDFVAALFEAGAILNRGAARGENNIILEFVRGLRGAMPGLRDFIVETTEQNGPRLLNFLRQFGRFMGVLVGPGGAMSQFLGLVGNVLEVFNAMPEQVKRVVVAYLAFGGIVTSIAVKLRGLVGLLTAGVAGKGLGAFLFGGARGAGFRLLIVSMIAFAPVAKTVEDAIEAITTALTKMFDILTLGNETIQKVVLSLIALEIATRVMGGTTLINLIGRLRALVQVMRMSQRTSTLGRVLEGLGAQFPKLTGMITRSMAAIRGWSAFFRAQMLLAGGGFRGFLVAVQVSMRAAVAAVRAGSLAMRLALATTLVGAIALVVFGLIELYQRSERFRRIVKTVFRELANVVADFLRMWLFFIDKYLAGLALIAEGASKLPFIGDTFKGIADDINLVREKLRGLPDMIDDLGEEGAGKEAGRRLAQNLVEGFNEGARLVTPSLGSMEETLTRDIQSMGNRLRSMVSSLGRDIVTELTAPFDRALAGQTPAEKAIAEIEARRARRQRTEQRGEATKRVTDAEAQLKRLRARFQARFGSDLLPVIGRAELERRRRSTEAKELSSQIAAAVKEVKEAKNARTKTYKELAEEELLERLRIQAQNERRQLMEAREAAAKRGRESMKTLLKAMDTFLNSDRTKADFKRLNTAIFKALGTLPPDVKQKLKEDIDAIKNELLFLEGAYHRIDNIRFMERVFEPPEFIASAFDKGSTIVLVPTKGPAQKRGGRGRAAGGTIDGPMGAPTPIMAHAGEWILNRSQQLRAAMMAGMDRSLLERALFHHGSRGYPRFAFAAGGVVQDITAAGGTVVNAPITINNPAAPLDPNYVARILETRMRSMS